MLARLRAISVGVCSVGIGVAGCSSSVDSDASRGDGDVSYVEGRATPTAPRTAFDLADACFRRLRTHAATRAADLHDGIVRWNCQDVPGVSGADVGQEYCEYHAVQRGRTVHTADALASGAGLTCLFTGVFAGEEAGVDRLARAMASPENLGSEVGSIDIVRMQHGANQRSAAKNLLPRCSKSAAEIDPNVRRRLAACYRAYASGSQNADALKKTCDVGLLVARTGAPLLDQSGQPAGWAAGGVQNEATWREAERLGARVLSSGEQGFDLQEDLTACLTTWRAGGVPWRKADPMLCSRVARAAGDCSCQFDDMPDSSEGARLGGWLSEGLPVDCRYAKVDGADDVHLVLCEASAQEISDLALTPQYASNVRAFCRERFAGNLAVKFQVRAVQKPGTCTRKEGFCSAYLGDTSP